jgi:succinate dehydrogenase hydrophobic anchor subunit
MDLIQVAKWVAVIALALLVIGLLFSVGTALQSSGSASFQTLTGSQYQYEGSGVGIASPAQWAISTVFVRIADPLKPFFTALAALIAALLSWLGVRLILRIFS